MRRRRPPRVRGAAALALLGGALPLAACAHATRAEDAPVTHAFDRPEETRLGRLAAPELARHPDETGLYVLGPGLDAFAARVMLVDAAERALDVQYYIFRDDVTGRILLSRLLAAADRGVRVRLLIDDVGTSGIDSVLAAADAHPELEVRLFNPTARGSFLTRGLDLLARASRLNHRMHNKMLAADGVGAVVGGRNVGDEYFDAAEGANFADLDLLVFGPVLGQLGESFDAYWNSGFAAPLEGWSAFAATADDLDLLRGELAEHQREHESSRFAERLRGSNIVRQVLGRELPLLWAPTRAEWDLPRKIVAEGDELGQTQLGRRIQPLFDSATREIDVVSPYFIPREAGTAYLVGLRERGVDVRILTNSLAATDVAAVHAGYRRYRRGLLEGGVALFELKPTGELLRAAHRSGVFGSSTASLHAKTFVIDGDTVFVGSLNLDPRSVDLNTELGLVVESEELAQRQRAAFYRITDPDLAWRVSLEDGDLVWTGSEDGKTERFTSEPLAGLGARFSVFLLGMLPIEGQL